MKIKEQRVPLKIVSWSIVILVMAIIFSFSSQIGDQSHQLSSSLTESFIRIIRLILPNFHIDADWFKDMTRKAAHVVLYTVLSLFVLNTLGQYRSHDKWIIFASVGICVLYAITDEIHQLFVQGRGAHVLDVAIDTAGACCGIGLYGVFRCVILRMQWDKQSHVHHNG
jgi:VanZ family protein